jgi:hypothetical protein
VRPSLLSRIVSLGVGSLFNLARRLTSIFHDLEDFVDADMNFGSCIKAQIACTVLHDVSDPACALVVTVP